MLLNYQTKDLYFAAYLLAKGKELLGIDSSESSNEKYFVFDDPLGCKVCEKEFWNYKGIIVPKEYSDAIRKAKERLYSGV